MNGFGSGRVLRVLEAAMSAILALSVFLIMAVTFFDVMGRYFLGKPLPAAYEMTEFLMAVAVFGALPLVTARREHVTITLLERAIWRGRNALQSAFVSLFSAIVMAVLARQIWLRAVGFSEYGDHSLFLKVPIAPFAYFMAAMAAAATLVLLAHCWAGLRGRAIVSGHPPEEDG